MLGKELFECLCVVVDVWGDVGKYIENLVKVYNCLVILLESCFFVIVCKFRELGVGNEDKELKELNLIELLLCEVKVILIKD